MSLLFLSLGVIGAQEPINGKVEVEGNQFFLIEGIGHPNRISPDGHYVVGTQDGAWGYLIDTKSKAFTLLSAGTTSSEALDVNSDGIVCGTFSDPNLTVKGFEDEDVPITVAGIYQQGAWTSLGIGSLNLADLTNPLEGSQANVISEDGKTAAGCLVTNYKITPCTWTENSDDTWTYNAYAYPANDDEAQGAKILTISGDGKIAGGWAVVELGGPRLPIIWKSPTDYTILSTMPAVMGVNCISNNGKYAAFAINNQPVLYYPEEDRYETIPGHPGAQLAEIIAISDNGLVTGYSQFGNFFTGYWRFAFIYSKEMGFVDLSNYIRVFAPDVQLPSIIDFQGKLLSGPMDISADGRVITGWHGANSQLTISWILKLAEIPQPLEKPRNFEASVTKENKVILSWDAPENPASELTGYRISRDNIPSDFVLEPNITAYEDTAFRSKPGIHKYTVSAVYTAGESTNSDEAPVIITDNHAIPFVESFDSGNLSEICWHPDGWFINTFKGRGIYGYGATANSGTSITKLKTLTSKNLDATALENVYLNYALKYSIPEEELTKDTLSVEVRYQGSGWTSIKKYIPDAASDLWNSESIDISAVAAGKFFQVRFCFYGENIHSSTSWDLDNVRVDFVPAKDAQAPSALMGILHEKTAEITWKTPAEIYELTYLKSNEIANAGNYGKPIIAAIAFDESNLALYRGKYLSSVSVVINQDRPDEELEIALVVFKNNRKIADQAVNSFVSSAWNTFRLEAPLLIDDSVSDLKIGINVVKHANGERPIGMDRSQSPTPQGNLFSEDGGNEWFDLLDDGGTRNNWAIIGNLTSTADETTPSKDENLLGYIIYRNDQNQGFVPLSRYTDDDAAVGMCYRVSAYYKDGLMTLPSEPFCLTTQDGINLTEVERATVFPNPASDYIRISGDFTKASLIDLSGKKIMETTLRSIPVSQIASGMYLLRIESGTQITTCKIIIK
ncbi:MAG: T9SS type A sorting domain-containing protein [Candidatus Symbiothrix sp.]|nr:T9SS type A sorting domain-containing protein [Candidatus Symbiothrix sp.]